MRVHSGAPQLGAQKWCRRGPSTLFTYFASKDDLLNQLLLDMETDLAQGQLASCATATTPRERVQCVWNTLVEWDQANPIQRKAMRQLSLRMGYGLPLATARAWGLYLSTSRGKTSIGIEEPALFSEPGVFLVRPDRTLYWLSVQSMPFARPNFDELVQALDFVIKNAYPARGEYVGELPDTI